MRKIPTPNRAVINLENGQQFDSLTAASTFLQIKVSTLQNAIARQSKVSYGTWRYVEPQRLPDRTTLNKVLATIEVAKQECMSNPDAFPSMNAVCLRAGVGRTYLHKYTPQSMEANEAYLAAFRAVFDNLRRAA